MLSLKNNILKLVSLPKEWMGLYVSMQKFFISLLIFFYLTVQTGCASIVSGKYQSVSINSNPMGAVVMLNEEVIGETPLEKKLKRKDRHTFIVKKMGFLDETRITKQGYNWWGIGNVLFGIVGLIGMAIDFYTGAGYTIDPDDININLLEGSSSLGG